MPKGGLEVVSTPSKYFGNHQGMRHNTTYMHSCVFNNQRFIHVSQKKTTNYKAFKQKKPSWNSQLTTLVDMKGYQQARGSSGTLRKTNTVISTKYNDGNFGRRARTHIAGSNARSKCVHLQIN